MRDTTKPIPRLSPLQEVTDGYERVHADLSQPDTIRSAVLQSGAKHAFIYMVFDSSDHMRASIEALKDAGIESVVLLSSISVQGDLHAVPPTDLIGFAHAQVEMNLLDIYGREAFTAVRPAFFASNSFWWAHQIATEAEVKTSFPDVRLDFISPEDIGAVCGAVLAGAAVPTEGDQGQKIVCLVGPESLSVAGAIQAIGRSVGKNVRVTTVTDEENLEVMVSKSGIPRPLAKHLIEQFAQMRDGGSFGSVDFQQHCANIERYLGRPPTRFEQWVEQNKENFVS
jgi:nucleoside-diphosphate-sugar epimerase